MNFFYFFKKESLRNWVTKNAESPQSTKILSIVSFSESVFLPIPPDVLLIAIISVRRVQRWFFFSSITTIFSVLGAVAGYLIGALFFDAFGEAIISFYGLQIQFDKISLAFQDKTFLTILVAAITPIPFKVFTLAGGLFKVNFFIFLIASIIGRAFRFYLVGYLTKLYGPTLARMFFKHFNLISLLIVILIVIVFRFVL